MHHSTSLKWVHEEFQEILEGSIHALDGIAEGSTGSAKLQDISNDLHELRLVLELMEVYGGAMLVEEMESLIQGLMEKKIEQEDAREILMMALLQLPAYLERVRTSSQDNPLLLLPLLNDIRAVQRRPLLSENSLFSPDLSLPIPGQPAPVLESGKVKPETLWLYFKRLRPYYQKALVQWFQGREEAKGLKLMGSVFEHLERVSGGTQIGHTWWIAAGVVEALREGGLTSNVTLKLLLGQLDRQIKGLAENGAAVLNSPVSPELQKNLLYYIARSRSAGERVKQIVTLFRLKELLPTESGDGAEAASWGPDLEVLNSVSDAVMEDLAQVKDTLDIFVRSDSSSPEDLGPMLETLKRVEDTLGLLGLGAPRKTVKSQSAAIERILASGEFPSEEILMGIAGALLDVDAALQGMAARGLGNAINQRDLKAEGGAVRLSHHEQAQLLATVVGEGGRNLAAVKEALIAFLDAPDSVDQLKSAIERSREVIGSLALLAYDKAARVLQECTRYMTEVLESRAPNLPPDEETLQAFADSLVGVECFLEAVKEGRTDCEGIIEWAAQRLTHLGMAPEIGVEEQDQDIEEVSLAPEPEEPEEPEEEL
ncbi:MAG: hypothetical protein GY731_06520, partial [Gammaproteobacteria bacterium]|nr:hypothetical protein [Gammaproteobacteria bacterium]